MAIRLSECGGVIYEIPKTGTTWMRAALEAWGIPHELLEPRPECINKVCPRHSTPAMYPDCDPADAACVVRHPMKWLRSFWMYHGRGRAPSPRQPGVRYAHAVFWDKLDPVFDVYVKAVELDPGCVGRYFQTFANQSGEVMRQEFLAEDFRHWLAGRGYSHDRTFRPVKRANVSPGFPPVPSLVTERIVAISERECLERYYAH